MTTAKTLLSAALIAATGVVSAQNQSWVADDYLGVTHSIADDINEGKTVLVDLSAHWCPPCWSWHGSGIMEKMYAEYGPDGTGDVEIYMIDASGNTANTVESTLALIEGAAGSMGDWTEGTEYPIIGPGGQGLLVRAVYNFSAFPTLFMHHPGATTGSVISRESTFQEFLESWANSSQGAFDNAVNDATLYGEHDAISLCPGESPKVELVNAGTSMLTSAVVTMSQNGNVIETVNWSGNLAQFETEFVSFNTAVNGWAEFLFTVSDPNGQYDGNQFGNSELVAFEGAMETATSLTFELQTDDYPAETGWTLTDDAGTVIDQVAAGTYTAANTLNSYTWTLNSGTCYNLEITDAFGDGICCSYGNGFYRLGETGTTNVFVQGGEFGGAEAVPFAPNTAVSVNEVSADNALNIFPNPSTGLVNVQIATENSELVNIQVYNLLGELVMNRSENFSAGTNTEVFDLSELNNGVYYFNIKAGDINTSKRVAINK